MNHEILNYYTRFLGTLSLKDFAVVGLCEDMTGTIKMCSDVFEWGLQIESEAPKFNRTQRLFQDGQLAELEEEFRRVASSDYEIYDEAKSLFYSEDKEGRESKEGEISQLAW